MNYATFVGKYPEFSDASEYSQPVVETTIAVCSKLVNAERWGDLTEHGIGLLTAHYMVLSNMDGSVKGILTSKSVDNVAATMDVSHIQTLGAGHYNASSYGILFYQLAKMFGAGGIQVS